MLRECPPIDPKTAFILCVLAIALAVISLGCGTKVVELEVRCAFAELEPPPELPAVRFFPPSGGCLFFRCIDEKNARLLQEREALLRGDSRYVREVYEEAKARCER